MRKILVVLAVIAAGALAIWLTRADDRERRFTPAVFRSLKAEDAALTRVEIRLLRNRPTITGVAVPKYYLWVRTFAGDAARGAAALRISDDVDGVHVLQTVTREDVRRAPSILKTIFPAALVPEIEALARSGD